MKILILYGGKNGTTKKCAYLLKDQILHADIADINNVPANINDYELIIFGTSIHMGMIDKSVKNFMSNYKDTLKNKKYAFYICCGFEQNKQQYLDACFEKTFVEDALTYECFGGELNINELKGFDKFIAKMVTKQVNPNTPKVQLNKEAIHSFGNFISCL